MIKRILTISSIILILFPPIATFAITPAELNAVQGDSEYYRPDLECGGNASAAPSASTSGTPIGSGSSVYILGDSITVRTTAAYQAAFTAAGITSTVDAQSGRALTVAGTSSENGGAAQASLTTGMQAITQDAAKISQAGAIVVALGTNPLYNADGSVAGPSDTTAAIDASILAIRADNKNAPIYWVDTIDVGRTTPGSSWASWDQTVVGPTNQAIDSQASPDGYQVISWFKAVDPNGNPATPNGTETDTNGYIDNSDGYGFHPSTVGETALAELVSSSVTTGQSSSTSTTNSTSASCSCGGTGGTVDGNITTTGNAAWNSTVKPPYYLEEFAINALQDLAQTTSTPTTSAVTQQHVLALIAWFWAEGGDIENSDLYNPLNTSLSEPGSVVQSTGFPAYASFNSGIQALVQTFTGSLQTRIAVALTNPSTTAQQVVQAIAYFQNYPGNHAWSTSSTPAQYYAGIIANVNQISGSGYNKEAATEIGTSAYEENTNLRVPYSELVYGTTSSSSSSSSATEAASSDCSSTTTTSIPGTYQRPLRAIKNLVPERIDQGVDFSGTGPIYAIGDGKVILVGTHVGWPGGVFISYTLTDGPATGKTVYVAECVTPSVSVGQVVSSSTVIATMTNCGSGIETGWAQPSNGSTTPTTTDLAMAGGVYQEGDVTAFGVNFSQLLKSLGDPAGIMDKPTITGTLPPGWPTWQ